MSRLALFCAKWRFAVVGAWLFVLIALAGATLTAGAAFTDVTDLPDGEASRAYALLDHVDPGSGETENGTIVWKSDEPVDSKQVRTEVNAWLDEVAAAEGVQSVVSPYDAQGAAQLNSSENTAYATVAMTDEADSEQIREHVEDLAQTSGTPMEVGFGGQAFTEKPGASGGTEAIGLLAALAILMFVFRSAWAASLTILTGVVGVGASMFLIILGTHVVNLSATSITMAALIGLGVGIDYALFIVNRFRNGLMAGLSVPKAITQAIDTSGRAVVFAGLTVAVGLFAMFIVGLGILTGMAQAAAVAVICTVLTAITLLPALLTILGTRVLSRRQRESLAAGTPSGTAAGTSGSDAVASPVVQAHPKAARWAGLVTRFPKTAALVALGLMVVLALPVASMRLGNSDASSDPAGSPGREYAELIAPAFGDGVDATLVLVAETPDQQTSDAFAGLVADLDGVDDVANVSAAPIRPGQEIAVAAITPTTSAQTEETEQLVHTLRDDVIPAAENGTDLHVLVGGETASNIDIGDALMGKLPIYLAVVALLGFLLLIIAFRSILVPLVGAITNVGTLLVGLGAITVIFQFGWGSEQLGVGTGAPVMYIVPVIIVGVMFGLSMDYQVFLVSRMHEEWHHTKDNVRSIKVGLTETAKVIGTAATIMLAVFASFGFSGERIVSAIGIGLAVAVVVDAFVVRMVLVPALMKLIGNANWYYPLWADRITPRLSIEGPSVVEPRDDTVSTSEVKDDALGDAQDGLREQQGDADKTPAGTR